MQSQSQAALDDIVIRSMTSADVKQVQKLHDFLLPLVKYPNSFFLQLLIMPGRHCIIAVDPSRPTIPIAFLSALVHNAPNTDYGSEREELDYLVDEYLRGRESIKFGRTIPRRKGGSGILSGRDEAPVREPRIELLTLGVNPVYRQNGLGRRLVQEMVCHVQTSLPNLPTNTGLAIDTNLNTSITGLPPPSPGSPVTPIAPDDLSTRRTYFETSSANKALPSSSKSLIVYANVATTNLPAISFYERLGIYVIPNVKLDGVYKGQGQSSRILSNTNLLRLEPNGLPEGPVATRNSGMGNSCDAYIVVGLM